MNETTDEIMQPDGMVQVHVRISLGDNTWLDTVTKNLHTDKSKVLRSALHEYRLKHPLGV